MGAPERRPGPKLFSSRLYAEPYHGVTVDGRVLPGLYKRRSERAPIAPMVDAARQLLNLLALEQQQLACFPIDAPEWRRWQNTEIYAETGGLRLEEANDAIRNAVLALMRASLSAKGYEQSVNAMRLNRFLGDLVGGPAVMNEWSYSLSLFGEPSLTEPWGWQCFGHHMCLNCFVLGDQMVFSPAFWGRRAMLCRRRTLCRRWSCSQPKSGLACTLSGCFRLDQQAIAIVAHLMVGGDYLPVGGISPTTCISAAHSRITVWCPMRD